jgi:hypothetical protein
MFWILMCVDYVCGIKFMLNLCVVVWILMCGDYVSQIKSIYVNFV